MEHLVPALGSVILDFTDVVADARAAALDGLTSEVDVFIGFPCLFEEFISDPFNEDALVVSDVFPTASVDSQYHDLSLPNRIRPLLT